MKLSSSRPVHGVAIVLWIAVIVAGAWLAAQSGRKNLDELSVVGLLDGFTPERFRTEMILDGGTTVIDASASDGSYVLRFPQGSEACVLVETGGRFVNQTLQGNAPETAALRRSLGRALAGGHLMEDEERTVRRLQERLPRG
jgi:hypothetical protein